MRYEEPTPEKLEEWKGWVADRPDPIREVAERFDPWTIYRLKTSGHRVVPRSFYQRNDGCVMLTVEVLGRFNFVAFERNVFGIYPEDLEECDLPGPDEKLGNQGLSIEQVKGLFNPSEIHPCKGS